MRADMRVRRQRLSASAKEHMSADMVGAKVAYNLLDTRNSKLRVDHGWRCIMLFSGYESHYRKPKTLDHSENYRHIY